MPEEKLHQGSVVKKFFTTATDGKNYLNKDADTHARDAYDRFAERRRKHKELTGHEESIKQLEDTAKQLSNKENKS